MWNKNSIRSKRRNRSIRNKDEPESKRLTDIKSMSLGNPLEPSEQPGKLHKDGTKGNFTSELREQFENLVLKVTHTASIYLVLAAGLAGSAAVIWFSKVVDAFLDKAEKLGLSLALGFGALWSVVEVVESFTGRPFWEDLAKPFIWLATIFFK